jgi:stage II sporulation protein D
MTAHLRPHIEFRVALCAGVLVLASLALLAAPANARADSLFAVSGRGWGHGIGMTQYGAMGYADQGKTYDWILAHYFQHTALATRDELTVKVDLDVGKSARSSWHIAAASSTATLTVTDLLSTHSVQVRHGASVWVKFAAAGAVVCADRNGAAGSVVATFTGPVIASTASLRDSEVRIVGTSGPFQDSGIAWRGPIRFSPHDATSGHAIDYVPMEQYIRGVVPRESPSGFPTQALRTQAVAARSYAYDAASSGSTLWCTTMSQVYNGAAHGSASHEAASTDSAVSATANQYVVYGSTVVQAFFSSSSGGHTANIEDVWFGSSPKPYYTGVTDADNVSGNKNYRWTLADMSGTTLAGKVRSHYASESRPSPARVTNVTVQPAASGWVLHVTLHWSSGADTVLTGPEFQHALGMKSSAFSVKLLNPPPVTTRYQQTDSRPLWTGRWVAIKTASASGGSYQRAGTAGAAVTLMFKGTIVSWIGTKGTRYGKADVSLDGARVATVDLYDSSTHNATALWTKTGLAADTTHTLVIKVLGTHRTGATSTDVSVDAFDIAGTPIAVPRPPVWKRYEQNTSGARYSGAWKSSSLAMLSGDTHAYSKETSAAVVYTFTGSQVRWIGRRAANYGQAWVSVDQGTPVLIDLYSATTFSQRRLFESSQLTAGTHTLTIRVAGKKNTKATDDYIDVDAFEALQPVK